MPKSLARPLAALAMLIAVVALAACGEKSESGRGARASNLKLALDFFPNPDHAGIYRAQHDGFFRDAGLDVKIQAPPPDDLSLPVKQAARGQVDLAITYEPEVLLARERGLDVVAVGALVQRPLTSLVWTNTHKIHRVADLKGKRIATAGIAYQQAYLRTILERAHVKPSSVKRVDVGENLVKPLISGRVDAVLGAFWNYEGVQLRLRGKHPVVKPVDEVGVPSYDELVLVTSRRRLEKDPGSLRLFLAALRRGTDAARGDRRGTTLIMRKANPDLDRRLARATTAATLPALEARRGKPFGYLDPARWRDFGGWMTDNGLLRQRPETDRAISNDLLPQGPRG